jgi:hypothetical protein
MVLSAAAAAEVLRGPGRSAVRSTGAWPCRKRLEALVFQLGCRGRGTPRTESGDALPRRWLAREEGSGRCVCLG